MAWSRECEQRHIAPQGCGLVGRAQALNRLVRHVACISSVLIVVLSCATVVCAENPAGRDPSSGTEKISTVEATATPHPAAQRADGHLPTADPAALSFSNGRVVDGDGDMGGDMASVAAALMDLWVATGGPSSSWQCAFDWNETANPCTWDCVACDSNNEHVIGVLLGPDPVTGAPPCTGVAHSRPDAIARLSQQQLPQQGCGLTGTVPDSFARIALLQEVYFAYSDLSSIPGAMFSMLQLRTLSVSFNPLGASALPATDWLLPAVQHIMVDGTGIGGPIPEELCRIGWLQTFSANEAGLSGEFPPCLGGLTNLKVLRLASNQLEGQLPSSMSDYGSIQQLDLSGNDLTGPLPDTTQWASIKHVVLSNNRFNGSMPNFSAAKFLGELRLANNHLAGEIGEIPSSVALFDISNNRELTGTLHVGRQMAYASVSNTALRGTLQPLADLASRGTVLHTLLASNCGLGGSLDVVPWDKLRQLSNLDLSGNALVGSVPPSMAQLHDIKIIVLSRNQLNGTLPDLPASLKSLVLFNNNLEGPLTALPKSLQVALFTNNSFTGPAPSLPHVQYYDVSYNDMHGSVPALPPSAVVFRAVHNRLNAGLNETSVPWSSIHNVSLALNRLSGPLPNVPASSSMPLMNRSALSVLQGNMFECPFPGNQSLFYHDTGVDTAQCVGLLAQTPMGFALAAVVCVAALLALVSCRRRHGAEVAKSVMSETWKRMLRGTVLVFLGTCVCCVAYFLIPSSLTHAGYWRVTAAYAGDTDTPRWWILALWCLPVATMIGMFVGEPVPEDVDGLERATEPLASTTNRPTSRMSLNVSSGNEQAGGSSRCYVGLKFALIILIPTVLNAGFVVAENMGSSGVQATLQAALGGAKGLLNYSILIWAARLATGSKHSAARNAAWLRFSVALQHVNSVLLPAATVLFLQPRCLLFATKLASQAPTIIHYQMDVCDSWVVQCAHPNPGNCTKFDATCHSMIEVPRTAVLAYPWRWDSACPASLSLLYGQVFLVSQLSQIILDMLRVWATMPGTRRHRQTLYADKIAPTRDSSFVKKLIVGPNQESLVREKARLYNSLEVVVVWGTFDVRVAVAGLLAMVSHWLAFRAQLRMGVQFDEDDPELPLMAPVLTVASFWLLAMFYFAGGELLREEDRLLGVAVTAGIGVVMIVVLLLLERRRRRKAADARGRSLIFPNASAASFDVRGGLNDPLLGVQ